MKNNTYENFKRKGGTIKNVVDSLLYIKGIVLNEKDASVTDQLLTLISASANSLVMLDTTDANGRFMFPLESHRDSMQFAIQIGNVNSASKKTILMLDTFEYPTLKTPVTLKQYLPLQKVADTKKRVNNYYFPGVADKKSLQPVNVKYTDKADYDKSKRVSSGSTILASADLDERTSVGNAILRVGGMHVLNGVLVVNGLTALKAPDISSDGVQITGSARSGIGESGPVLSYLNSLNPKDIDFIEILKGADGANYGI